MQRIHEILHLEQASTPRLFMGGWEMDQNTRHIKTRNDLARSVVIYVQMWSKEIKADAMLKNPKQKLHVRRGNFTISFPKKLRNLTPSERQEEAGGPSGTSNAMRETKSRCHRQDTDAESCNVKSRRGGRRPRALSEGDSFSL